MHDPAIFNFRPSSLVRMSRDDIIDQYKIYPIKIGEGNDAVVYKAKQNFNGGQWRAIKKIHRSYVDKEEYLLTEIEILKRLDHPGVLKIFQVFDDSQYVSIVTELCQGNSLIQQLKKRGYYSQTDAKQIFRKLLEVVSYCHQNKIIHRDLKLQNLVYCTEKAIPQSLRLIDFGMAFQWKSSPRQEIKNTFESNKVVGTIYYMAPQIRNQTYDQRVDIWSCGVILFSLLTGELPFDHEQDEDIMEAIKQRKINYEKLRKRKCSNEVIDLLKKIFVSEMKRISIEEILNHPWLKKSFDEQKCIGRKSQNQFSLLMNRQFLNVQQFRQYYRQKIQSIVSIKDRQSEIPTNQRSNLNQKNIIDYSWLNWINFYQFLALDEIEKAIKIYLTYRLTQEKSQKYTKIFNYFKSLKKQNILLLSLHDQLYKQYQHFLNQSQENIHSQNIILSQYQLHHHKKRQLSIKQDQNIFSIKKVYQKLLSFLQQNKYRTVGYTMFVSWICDFEDLDKGELDFLRNKLRNKNYEDRDKRRDAINQQINNIHKIIRNTYLQKRAKNKSQFSYKVQTTTIDSMQRSNRNIPLLSINVQKIKENQNMSTKRTSKKSIKQNILESISPTFIRRNNTQHKKPPLAAKTQRPIYGNRLLQNIKQQSTFMMGIHKIIPFL